MPVPPLTPSPETHHPRFRGGGWCALAGALAVMTTSPIASAQPRQAPPPIEGTGPGATPATEAAELPPAPAPPSVVSATTAGPSGDEASILGAINALRAARSLAPLTAHAGLMEAAREHSAEMARARTLAHVSPTTGTPVDRAAAAGVQALRVTQNISRRPSATAAHEAILASDAHLAQLLDAHATHIGVGVATGADGVYLTELLAHIAPEPELPPPSVVDVPQPPGAAGSDPPQLAEPEPYDAEPPSAAAPAAAPQARAQPVQAQTQAQPPTAAQGQATTPTLRITRAHRGIAGYWLFHQGRWWYFPIPPGTRQGQLLYPDTRVQGSPPGYQGTPQTATQVPTRVQPPVTTAPRGYWRLTPQ